MTLMSDLQVKMMNDDEKSSIGMIPAFAIPPY